MSMLQTPAFNFKIWGPPLPLTTGLGYKGSHSPLTSTVNRTWGTVVSFWNFGFITEKKIWITTNQEKAEDRRDPKCKASRAFSQWKQDASWDISVEYYAQFCQSWMATGADVQSLLNQILASLPWPEVGPGVSWRKALVPSSHGWCFCGAFSYWESSLSVKCIEAPPWVTSPAWPINNHWVTETFLIPGKAEGVQDTFPKLAKVNNGLFKNICFHTYVSILPACMYMQHVHARCLRRSIEGFESPETSTTDPCEPAAKRSLLPGYRHENQSHTCKVLPLPTIPHMPLNSWMILSLFKCIFPAHLGFTVIQIW